MFRCQYMVLAGTGSLLVDFVKKQFNPTAEEVGTFVSLNYSGKAFGVVFLLPIFLKWYAHPVFGPLTALQIGVLVAIAAYPLYANVAERYVFVVTVVEGFDSVWETCVHAMTTVLVPDSEQGLAFGGLSFLRTLMNMLSPIIVNSTWAATVEWHPGFAFYMMSACSFVTLLLSMRLAALLRLQYPKKGAGLQGGGATQRS